MDSTPAPDPSSSEASWLHQIGSAFVPCTVPQEQIWITHMTYSTVCFASTLFLLGAWRLVGLLLRRGRGTVYQPVAKNGRSALDPNLAGSGKVKRFVAEIVSGQRLTGKILSIVEFLLGVTAFAVYVSRATATPQSTNWYDHFDWAIDFACHLALLVIFLLRLIGTNGKLAFLLSLDSFVDYFTIPTSIICFVCNDRVWLGLRFLRAFHIRSLPSILQIYWTGCSRIFIRLAQLVCVLLTMLFVGSGIFFLLEEPQGERSYWSYIYFSIITLSTVGYGDISPATGIGRLMCCLYILSAMAVFASSIPELASILSSTKRYSQAYQIEAGTGHVVVTGWISAQVMEETLRDFDRKYGFPDIKLVFVNNAQPDVELETVIKRNWTKMHYIQADILDPSGLQKAEVKQALACLFVANQTSSDPNTDDRTTVVSVASVKAYSPRTRCIVQLLQSHAKAALLNIPAFNLNAGDTIVCFHELELALMAKSCLAPGAATLIANMIRSPPKNFSAPKAMGGNDQIIQDYVHGCYSEIFIEHFSDHFVGMPFSEAVKFCFVKFEVLLIGLFETERDARKPGLFLCPGTQFVSASHMGIFVSTSREAAEIVYKYCGNCHSNVDFSGERPNISRCKCQVDTALPPYNPHDPTQSFMSVSDRIDIIENKELTRPVRPPGWEEKLTEEIKSIALFSRGLEQRDADQGPRIDASRSFYFQLGKPLDVCHKNPGEAIQISFENHVVVLVMAGPNDPPIGLLDFVRPLRSSRIPYEDLKDIVILGNKQFMRKEWTDIADLPRITFVDGSPLNRGDLRSVSIKAASMVVVVQSWTGSGDNPVLDDRDTILSVLNLKAMPFEEVKKNGQLATYYGVNFVTALQHDDNMRLLDDQLRETYANGTDNYILARPFMSGEVVTFKSFDSLFVASYTSPLLMPVMNHLLYGFQSQIMEGFLAEGVGIIDGVEYSPEAINPLSTRIDLVNVTEGPWVLPKKGEEISYAELVQAAAACHKICLGLSKKLEGDGSERFPRRCIVTNPGRYHVVRPDDRVFVLTQ